MGWERKRGKLHELNALLRGSTTTGILDRPDGRVDPADGRALRRHARRRHAPAARRRRAPGRDDRPSAQPADVRSADRPGHAGLRRAPAADHADAARRARRHRSSSGPSPARPGIDPYASAVSDVYQDLFARGDLHRQGDLRRRRVRRGDGRPGARERAAEPRPVRGRLRPGGAGDRHRAVRRVPVRTTWSRRRASIAGRAATGSSCPGSSAAPATRRAGAAGARCPAIAPLEDGRQPAPDAVAAAHAGHARRRVDAPVGVGRRCGRRSSWPRTIVPRAAARPRRAPAAPAGHLQAQPPARRRRAMSASPRRTSASASRSSPTRPG